MSYPGGQARRVTIARNSYQGVSRPVHLGGLPCAMDAIWALVNHLDGVSDADIVALNIPTGVPLVYEMTEDLRPIRHQYLGDPEQVRLAQEAVARQGQSGRGSHP